MPLVPLKILPTMQQETGRRRSQESRRSRPVGTRFCRCHFVVASVEKQFTTQIVSKREKTRRSTRATKKNKNKNTHSTQQQLSLEPPRVIYILIQRCQIPPTAPIFFFPSFPSMIHPTRHHHTESNFLPVGRAHCCVHSAHSSIPHNHFTALFIYILYILYIYT